MKEQVLLELWLLPVTCKKEVMQRGEKSTNAMTRSRSASQVFK